jgi:general secretion pathway protein D
LGGRSSGRGLALAAATAAALLAMSSTSGAGVKNPTTGGGDPAAGGAVAPAFSGNGLRSGVGPVRGRGRGLIPSKKAQEEAAAAEGEQGESAPAGKMERGGKTPRARAEAAANAAAAEDAAAVKAAGRGETPADGAGAETDPWAGVKDAGQMAIGIEYQRPKPGTRFAFNLVDADLIELVKIIGNITGKSFILGGKAPNIKATIYAPTKITAEEAYQAFLSVLQVNGLVVVPAGRYLKILPTGGSTQQNTPILTAGAPARDQIVTQLYPLQNVAGADLAPVLDRFKSPDGDITVYAPTNTLIITDYGTSIHRMLKLVALLDVPGTGEKIWIEPVNYADATELAARVTEIFDIAAGGAGKATTAAPTPKAMTKKSKAAAASAGASIFGQRDGEIKVSKIMADERTNSLIIVASEHAYLRILEIVKMLDVPIAGEGTLHVHKLQHADATELAKTLSTLSKQAGASSKDKKGGKAAAAAPAAGAEGAAMFEGEMQISADKATNSLVIVSSLRDYVSLKTVIEILDTMQRQVFVEAVIMEVSLDKNRDVGLGVHGGGVVGSSGEQSIIYGSSQPSDSSNSFTQVLSVPALTGLAAGVSGPEIPESQDLIGMSVPAFGVALYALQTNSDVNVLSTPQVLATDNVEASIQVGENVPVQQGMNAASSLINQLGAGTTSSTATSGLAALSMYGGLGSSIGRQNVGITLKVTPHINDDNQVRLEIDLEISEVKSIDPVTGPTISKQNAVTTSVVADQQTIVIGGLMTDNEVVTTTKVPGLGDIPILGMLFRHKSSLTKKRNLLIFMTPYIVRSAEDFREIFSRKMAERREFIERYTAFEYHRYDPHLDWARTNGAIAVVDQVVTQAAADEEMKQSAAAIAVDEHNPKPPIELPPGEPAMEGGEGDAAAADTPPGATITDVRAPLMQPTPTNLDAPEGVEP